MKVIRDKPNLKLGSFIKIIGSLIITFPAGYLIYLHSSSNLEGKIAFGTISETFTSVTEIPLAIKEIIRSSQLMNLQEIWIFICIPSVLLTLVLLIWFGSWLKGFRALVLLLFPLSAVFLLAQYTNIIGADKQIKRELPIWEKAAQLVEYSSAKKYILTDERNFETGRHAKIVFTTPDSEAELTAYYKNKNFAFKEIYNDVKVFYNENYTISFYPDSSETIVTFPVKF